MSGSTFPLSWVGKKVCFVRSLSRYKSSRLNFNSKIAHILAIPSGWRRGGACWLNFRKQDYTHSHVTLFLATFSIFHHKLSTNCARVWVCVVTTGRFWCGAKEKEEFPNKIKLLLPHQEPCPGGCTRMSSFYTGSCVFSRMIYLGDSENSCPYKDTRTRPERAEQNSEEDYI